MRSFCRDAADFRRRISIVVNVLVHFFVTRLAHHLYSHIIMKSLLTSLLTVAFAGSLIVPTAAVAIPITPDTFEDETTMGWFVPGVSPNPPEVILTGGPSGVGDAYLDLTATGGGGAGSRLAVLNSSQWMGDYLAAGITAITMDVNNFGPEDLVLRLLFENFGPTPGPPTDLALTLAGVFVPAGSGWISVSFDLTNVGALLGTVGGALGDVDTLRIFHNPDPTFPGPNLGIPTVIATLGVDNITAVGDVTAVPEPGTLFLVGAGIAVASHLRRRRMRRAQAS